MKAYFNIAKRFISNLLTKFKISLRANLTFFRQKVMKHRLADKQRQITVDKHLYHVETCPVNEAIQ